MFFCRRMKNDFCFLESFGYVYKQTLRYYSIKEIVFENDQESINIGFDFNQELLFARFYKNKKSLFWVDLVGDIDFGNKKYHEQSIIAKKILLDFLQSHDEKSR